MIMDALQSTFTIIAMILVGYMLTSRGWFDENTAKLFSRLVVKVSMPAFIVSNFITVFDKEKFMVLGTSLIYPLLSILIMFAVGTVLLKLMKTPPERKGIFLVMFALSNTIFIGLPINVSLFGEASVPYVILFYTVNTLYFWTVGVYAIKGDDPVGHFKGSLVDGIKKVICPPLVAFIIGIVLVMLEVRLPKFIMDTAQYMGNLTTPLSMLFMGITIHSIGFSEIKIDREIIAVLAGRFLIAPAVIYLLLIPASLPMLMKKVFIIEAAMPVLTQPAIVAKTYGGDYKYATIMVAVTTMVGMAFIPVYMLLLGNL